MIKVNEKDYKLCLLDSNILSEILKNKNEICKKVINKFLPDKYVLCYSIFSLIEIKKSKYLYDKYLEIFSIYPSLLMQGHESIFQEELKKYHNPNYDIKSWVIAPFAITYHKPLSNREKLEIVLNNPDFLKKEKYWDDGKQNVLDGIISLKDNYKPKRDKFTKNEINDFVYYATLQQIGLRAPDFTKIELEKGNIIDINKFPSIKATSYNVFYKFYPDNRKPQLSDVYDIIISSLIPYVDIIITEGHFYNTIKKIKKIDNFIENLENYSIKDFANFV